MSFKKIYTYRPLIAVCVFFASHLLLLENLGEKFPLLVTWISTSIFFSAYIFSKRLIFSTVFSLSILFTILAASVYKAHILGMPFMFNDIFYFLKDLDANKATLFHYPEIALSGLLVFAFFGGALFLCFKYDKTRLQIPFKRSQALIYIGLPLFLCTYIFQVRPLLNGDWDYFTALHREKNYLTKFYSSVFIFNNTDLSVDLKSYESLEQSSSPFANIPLKTASDSLSSYPDIVAILHESAFDIETLKDCPAHFCNVSLFTVDNHTVQSGPLQVHVKGGGTWLSEFAFLTGLDYRLFGNAGYYAPYTIAPKIKYSLPKSLKKKGYRTIAIYPVPGNFLHARNAYTHYGFDEFYSTDELNLNIGWTNLYDSLLYQKAFEAMKTDDHRPVFVFILTMFGHGPYDKPIPQDQFVAHPQSATNKSFYQLEDYRYRLRRSLQDIQEFESQLLNRERKTMLVRFGDHQPGFQGDLAKLQYAYPLSSMPKDDPYFTSYIIKSNYGKGLTKSRHLLDISFLGATIVHDLHIEDDAYFMASSKYQSHCQNSFFNCADSSTRGHYLLYLFKNLAIYE